MNNATFQASIVGNVTTSTVRVGWIVGDKTVTNQYTHVSINHQQQPRCK